VTQLGVAADRAFPEQAARTRGFQLGRPRTFTASAERVAFLRSKAGDDPVTCLWVLDLATGEERCVFDPRTSEHGPDETVDVENPAAERARRERTRELALGVVAYATDRDVTKAVFTQWGRLFLADLLNGKVEDVPVPSPPYDPRLDRSGRRVAYVVDGAIHARELGGEERALASDPDPDVRWGIADFAAAEEMDRLRGHWWSPDGEKLVAARVDERPVQTWYITDPTHPGSEPRAVRYPQAGTANAIVTLHVFDVVAGGSVEVQWDRDRFEYLARVHWAEASPLTILVQSRDQRTAQLLAVDDSNGTTTVLREDTDPAWVELVDGSPDRLGDGRIVTTVDREDRRRVAIDGTPVTPTDLHVRTVVGADHDAVWFTASGDDPLETHLYRLANDGPSERISRTPGQHGAVVAGGVAVVTSRDADERDPRTWVRRSDGSTWEIASLGETPIPDPRPAYAALGERGLRTAMLTPAGHDGNAPLPVLLSPYGGPHFQKAVRHRGSYVGEQWFADRLAAAVLVIDGRGTPARGVAWEKAVHRDFSVTLEDQVDGLQAAAKEWAFLDLERVAIRGWSFGGELSAMAVCTRPDVFHAAVAGAPVTDQRLYDTAYTERYLGDPFEHPEVYVRNSPIEFASDLRRPLLLIHGFADDNVVVANTLQMSARLFAQGIAHELVLIPDASHMGGTDDVVVARFLCELDFLRRSLGLTPPE
jgi:dipeptidyl-peptidase 4